MKTINKQPKIRFKGYTDEWEQRKLKDVLDVMDGDRGKNYPSSNDFLDNGHTLFLSASNVTKEGFQFTDNQFITENKSNSMGNGKVILNDIILTSRGSIGHTALYSNKINELYSDIRINSGMLILRSHTQNYPLFIIQFLKSPIGKRQIDFISFGSAQPQITKKDINNFPIQLPSKEEQIKIGDFFTKLDDIIALHQRKLEALEKTKKSFLEKMFPKKDETKPEIRFSGFTDDWEQRKLGEITKRVTRKNKELESTLPLTISAQYGLVDQITYFDKRIASKDVSNYYLIKKGEFAYNKSYSKDFPWGAVKRLDNYDKGVLSTLYIVFKPTDIESNFLVSYYDTTMWHKEVSIRAAEGARNHGLLNITAKDFFDTDLIISTNSKEQQKIGSFFKQLDDTIALHQRQLEVLKNMKTSFLQKMYI